MLDFQKTELQLNAITSKINVEDFRLRFRHVRSIATAAFRNIGLKRLYVKCSLDPSLHCI